MVPNPKRVLWVANGAALVVLFLFAWLARWRGVVLTIDPTQVLSKLTPLLLAATFIERAVEVIVSPWRDAGANKLAGHKRAMMKQTVGRVQGGVAGAEAGGVGGALVGAAVGATVDLQAVTEADDAFQNYKGQTQQYAFAVSLTLSLAAAFVGVRVLWPFVDQPHFDHDLGKNQQWMFLVVDFLLSVVLLAGGADGIHSVINAFTSFFNATAEKSQQQAGQ
jgi:hypothetical protein